METVLQLSNERFLGASGFIKLNIEHILNQKDIDTKCKYWRNKSHVAILLWLCYIKTWKYELCFIDNLQSKNIWYTFWIHCIEHFCTTKAVFISKWNRKRGDTFCFSDFSYVPSFVTKPPVSYITMFQKCTTGR